MNLRFPPVIVCAKANQMVYTMQQTEIEHDVACVCMYACECVCVCTSTFMLHSDKT